MCKNIAKQQPIIHSSGHSKVINGILFLVGSVHAERKRKNVKRVVSTSCRAKGQLELKQE